jgi:hypothetical protein
MIMDFEDTVEEAQFRSQVRSWIQANAPKHLESELRRASFGDAGITSEDPLKAKVVIDDTKKLQKKLDANKKVNEESKVAIDHLNKAMSELCKAQNVETPSQEAVDSGVKAAATQKLTVSDE